MARNPQAAKPEKPGFWGQAAELLQAPFKGAAQGAGQTARAINRVNPMQAGSSSALSPTEQDEYAAGCGHHPRVAGPGIAPGHRRIQAVPLTSTTASMILQDAGRLLTKAAGYSVMGGPVAAVAGTGLDEAATGFMEFRDQGVDPMTAAKAGAVRGAMTAAGIAIPVVGTTGLKTVGLIAAGGPLSFMAEQATTRAILENANYLELAAEHDAFDPVGLGVSTLVPGLFGMALHRARVRKAAAEAAGRRRQRPRCRQGLPTRPRSGMLRMWHIVTRKPKAPRWATGRTQGPKRCTRRRCRRPSARWTAASRCAWIL